MALNVCRKMLDRNQTGGKCIRGANSVLVNGVPVAQHVSVLTNHPKLHKNRKTTTASPDVFAEGAPIVRKTSRNNCGHSMVTGSSDVFSS